MNHATSVRVFSGQRAAASTCSFRKKQRCSHPTKQTNSEPMLANHSLSHTLIYFGIADQVLIFDLVGSPERVSEAALEGGV